MTPNEFASYIPSFIEPPKLSAKDYSQAWFVTALSNYGGVYAVAAKTSYRENDPESVETYLEPPSPDQIYWGYTAENIYQGFAFVEVEKPYE